MLLHYAAATWAIPAAHAFLSDERPIKAAHVEPLGDKNCQPVHNHLNCSAFSVARLLAAPPPAARVPDGDHSVAARRPAEPMGRPLIAVVSSLGSRAPPLV
jgi:hypothetical protein